MKSIWLIFLISMIAFAGRFFLPVMHQFTVMGSYQAFAHIWVGFLLALSIVMTGTIRRIAIELLTGLILLEVLVFVGG
jgi:hypothetical protein